MSKFQFLHSVYYLIRTNFRADKFSRIFAQNLDLREIARKLVPNFWRFVAGARKFFRAKIFKLHILKKAIQKVLSANYLREIARKLVLNFEFVWKVRENKSARKLVRIRYSQWFFLMFSVDQTGAAITHLLQLWSCPRNGIRTWSSRQTPEAITEETRFRQYLVQFCILSLLIEPATGTSDIWGNSQPLQ